MSLLAIYPETGENTPKIYNERSDIIRTLNDLGVQFETWPANQQLDDNSTQEEVLTAYHDEVNRLSLQYGFKSADVVSLTPDHPDAAMFRNKFISEHTHSDFEVRFFVDGTGLFYLHIGKEVYVVFCEKNDLISVPANTPHWFDMGAKPFFKCIRLFSDPEGWVGHFTESFISEKFPDYDSFCEDFVG